MRDDDIALAGEQQRDQILPVLDIYDGRRKVDLAREFPGQLELGPSRLAAAHELIADEPSRHKQTQRPVCTDLREIAGLDIAWLRLIRRRCSVLLAARERQRHERESQCRRVNGRPPGRRVLPGTQNRHEREATRKGAATHALL